MDNIEKKELLSRYFEGSLCESDRLALIVLLNDLSDMELLSLIQEVDTPAHFFAARTPKEVETGWSDLLLLLPQERGAEGDSINRSASIKTSSIRRWAAVVAATICVLISAAFLIKGVLWSLQETSLSETEISDVAPATALAIVTWDKGEVIFIDSSQRGLVYDKGGVSLYRDPDGVLDLRNTKGHRVVQLTVRTPKGGIAKVRLSDGTLVELNAEAAIRYPSMFVQADRAVFLEGEAFFSVAHDVHKPFKVRTAQQTIQVLGTTFNLVSRYGYAKTTLIDGSVKILTGGDAYYLKPGEQAVVGDQVQITKVQTAQTIAWKNEAFIFDHCTFYEILKEIERWYDVHVVLQEGVLEDINLSGTVSRKANLSALLHVLEMNTSYQFTIEGRRVLMQKK